MGSESLAGVVAVAFGSEARPENRTAPGSPLGGARELLTRHGGSEVAATSGGLTATFATARAALACALDMRARFQGSAEYDRGAAIAVHAGELVVIDEHVSGEAVITAAAIAQAVPPHEVWCTVAARELAGDLPGIAFVPKAGFRPHPFDVPRDLFAVSDRSGAHGRRARLAGRDRELVRLMHELHRALAGRGGVALVVGEAGVGKTRLAEELAGQARLAGAYVLTGRCDPGGGAPYLPFADMLTDLLGRANDDDRVRFALGDDAAELARLLPRLRSRFPSIPPPLQVAPEHERRLLSDAIFAFLARTAAAHPVLLVLDDLQWADEGSLFLLGQLADRVAARPIFVLLTARDDELDVREPPGQLAEELLRRRLAQRVQLRRLASTDVAAMLRDLGGRRVADDLVDAIWSVTDGNPFFVEEVYRHLGEEGRLLSDGGLATDRLIDATSVPDTVRLTLQRRLDRLGEITGVVLSAAAVIGRVFPVRLLEALREVSPAELADSLELAERAHLVQGTADDSLTFTHELVRQTLLAGITTLRRRRLHARAADAIERMALTPDDHAATIAHHLHEAGDQADPEKSLHFLALAGERALSAAAYGDALRFFDRALKTPNVQRWAAAGLLRGRGSARHGTGDWPGAVDDWYAALEAYAQLNDTQSCAAVALLMMRRMTAAGRLPQAREVGSRALAVLDESGAAERARVRALLARVSGLAGDRAAADRLLAAALADAEAVGDQRLEGELFAQSAMLHWTHMETAAGLETATLALDRLGTGGDRFAASEALWEQHSMRALAARLEEVRAGEAELATLATSTGNAVALYDLPVIRSMVALCDGDLEAVVAAAEETIAFCSRTGMAWESVAHGYLGWAKLWQDDVESAVDYFREAVRREPRGFYRGGDRGSLALSLAVAGERDAAVELIAELRSAGCFPDAEAPATQGSWAALLSVIEALVVLGERDEAAALYPLALAALGTGTVIDLWGARLLDRIAGLAAAAGGRWDEAEQHFRAALTNADVLPHRLEQPSVRRAYAQLLVERDAPGDRQHAAQLIDEAVRQYRALGATGFAAAAQAVLKTPTLVSRDSYERQAGSAEAGLRREGDVWAISYAGRVTRVRDVKGIHYLVTLLQHPGRELHALDLAGGATATRAAAAADDTDGQHLGFGDAGPILDQTAKAAYRQRLNDLAEDLEEARTFNDLDRAAKIEAEVDALTEQLTRAVGIGGRDRRAASAAERARLNVTRAIRAAIDRIDAAIPELGTHLRLAVRTGTYCSYQPDPAATPTWSF